MLNNREDAGRFRNSDYGDLDQTSNISSLHEVHHWSRLKSCGGRLSWRGWLSKRPEESATEERTKRRWCWRGMGISFIVLSVFVIFPGVVYIAFVSTLIRRLAPPPKYSGLDHIVDIWQEPDFNGAFTFDWPEDFSRDIVPKPCHSHNDYWRSVPLYEALAVGCISIEADIWLTDDSDFLVSHSWDSATQNRTLKSLYLDPLVNILTQRNVSTASSSYKRIGVFDTSPNTSIILLIDFKSDGAETWPILLSQLAPLRDKNWLTYYDGETLHLGPLTIVGTGNTPFNLIQQNSTNRYIFFDAPLLSISDDQYNTTNSYYASSALKPAVGRLWFNTLSSRQVDMVQKQVRAAQEKGLKSRYWDTPSWPISARDGIWRRLEESGVGILNVDDLVSATRWNWRWCVVAGIALCGKS